MDKSNLNKKELQMMKLNEIAGQYIDDYKKKVDYQELAEQMKEFSGAKYVMFNIFDDIGKDFTLVGFAGNIAKLKKISDIIGFDLIGSKWEYEEKRNERFEKSIVSRIDDLKELVGKALPNLATNIIAKTLKIDHVKIIRITKDERTKGNFTLIYTESENETNDEILKLFASQVGLFLEKKEYERKNIETLTRLQSLLKNSISLIMLFNNRGEVVEISDSASRVIGLEKDEIIGKSFSQLLSEENSCGFYNTINIINKGKNHVTKKNATYINGERRIFENVIFPVEIEDNKFKLYGSIANDVTENETKQEEIEYLSYHDHLTGLYNRRFFEAELNRLDVKRNLPLSLMIVDVNGLKLINDAFGHDKGDEILVKIAELFRDTLRSDEITARVGGDEFSIILPNCSGLEAAKIINRMQSRFIDSIKEDIPTSIAIGCSTKTKKNQDISNVLKEAENKMYNNKLFSEQSKRREVILSMLSTLHEKHPREEEHSKRVSLLSHKLGKKLKLKDDRLNMVKTAGLLHDIGKIAIDYSVLDKTEKLKNKEYEEVKKHTEIGYRILKSSIEYEDIAKIVLYHHERIDGKGYPEGLKGNNIPLESRIISIVDAYDAMISQRPYKKKPLSIEEAKIELKKNSGMQFDKHLVKVFLEEVIEK